jgi:hypothetical protein
VKFPFSSIPKAHQIASWIIVVVSVRSSSVRSVPLWFYSVKSPGFNYQVTIINHRDEALNYRYLCRQPHLHQLALPQSPAVAFPVHQDQALQVPVARPVRRQQHPGAVDSIFCRSGGEVLGREERHSFLSCRAGESGLCRPDGLVVYGMQGEVDGRGRVGRDLLRLEGESRQAGGLVVRQRAGGHALRRAQGINVACGGEVLAAAADLHSLLDGEGAYQVFHAAAIGKGRA